VIRAALLGLAALTAGSAIPHPATRPDGAFEVAAICSRTGEKVNGDGSKTCFYSCSGVGQSMTVAVNAVCPLTVPAPRG
jgi:hypothetical protein